MLQEWIELEKEYRYREEFGDSRTAAYERIAKKYSTNRTTVRRYLVQQGIKRHKNPPYDVQAQNLMYKPRQNFYRRFKYNPARYLIPLYRGADEVLSLEELSVRLHGTYDYLPYITTLERVLTQQNQQIGGPVLEKVPGEASSLYRLRAGLYDKYFVDLPE